MLPNRRARVLLALCSVAPCASSTLAAEAYTLTVTPGTSVVTYDFSASAPFTGTLAGDPIPVQPPAPASPVLPSRLKRGSTGILCVFTNGCSSIATTVNETTNFTGTVSGAGSNTATTPQRPTGTYTIAIDPAALTAEARNINLNLVGTTPITTAANLQNFQANPPFCIALGMSTTPSCTVPSCSVPSIPLGNVAVTAISVVQPGPAAGTLTPVSGNPNAWDFNIPVNATFSTTQSYQGSAFPSDPQVLPIVLTGRLTRTGQGTTATASATTNFSVSSTPPTNTTPSPLGAQQVQLPADSTICANVPILVNLTLTSTTIRVSSTAALIAGGPRLRCPVDADNNGVRNVDDIFVFINLWFAGSPAADFDGLNGRTIDDIFIFLNAWFASPFPC